MSRRIECPHPHLCGVKSHEPERGAIVECQRKGRGFTVTDRRGAAHLGASLDTVNSVATKAVVAELPSEDDILDMLDEDDYAPEPTFSEIIGDDGGRHVAGREPGADAPATEAIEEPAPEPAQVVVEEPIAQPDPVAITPADTEGIAPEDQHKMKLGKDATRAAQEIGRDARHAGPTVLDLDEEPEDLIPDAAQQRASDPTAQLQMASCPNPDVCGSQQHIVGSLSHQLCQRLSIKLEKMSQPAVPAITPRPVQDLAKYHRAGEVIAQAVRKAPRNALIGVGLGLVTSIAIAGPLFLPVMGAYFAFQGARYGWAAYRAANPGDDFAGTVTKIAAGMVAQRMSNAERRNDPQGEAPEEGVEVQEMSPEERDRLNTRLEELFTRYDKMDEEFVEIANEYGGVQQLQQMLNTTEDKLARA